MAQGTDEAARFKLAASLAARSDHPVSMAISDGLKLESEPVENFKALAGPGVQEEIAGKSYVPGNHRLIEERGQCSDELEAACERTRKSAARSAFSPGKTAFWLCSLLRGS